MKKVSRCLLQFGLVFSLAFAGLAPASAVERVTLKDKYFTLTYPATVTMPAGNCGKFTVNYAMSPLLTKKGVGEIEIALWSRDPETGEYADAHAGKSVWYKVSKFLNSPLKGSIPMQFCKTDWKLKNVKSRDEAFSVCTTLCKAVTPGTYVIVYNLGFAKGESESTLVRTETTQEGDITFIE